MEGDWTKSGKVRRGTYIWPCALLLCLFMDTQWPLLTQAIMKVESPVKSGLPPRISEWTNDHLPFSTIDKWHKVFITTFAAYIGTKRSLWDLKNKETLGAMQDCWDHIYQSTSAATHKISRFCNVIFVLVSILTLFGFRLMGTTEWSKMEGVTKLHCQNCPPGNQWAF